MTEEGRHSEDGGWEELWRERATLTIVIRARDSERKRVAWMTTTLVSPNCGLAILWSYGLNSINLIY